MRTCILTACTWKRISCKHRSNYKAVWRGQAVANNGINLRSATKQHTRTLCHVCFCWRETHSQRESKAKLISTLEERKRYQPLQRIKPPWSRRIYALPCMKKQHLEAETNSDYLVWKHVQRINYFQLEARGSWVNGSTKCEIL